MKLVLIAMSVCFLYIIIKFCNFLNRRFKHGIQDGRQNGKWKILFIGDILQFFFSKNHHIFAIIKCVFDIT